MPAFRRPGELAQARDAPRPAAFIDRDGTLVVERHYLADPDAVELVPDAGLALRRLAAAGFALVLITNQSGIARGLYTERDFERVQHRLAELLATQGVVLDGVYYCPHHPDFTGPCECRKPALALFRQAAEELSLDLRNSCYIGDRLKDVLPAQALGGQGYLVRTGYGADQESDASAEIIVVDDLAAAVATILQSLAPVSAQGQQRARVDTSQDGR